MTLADQGRPRLPVTAAGKFCNALIDSGADVCCVNRKFLQNIEQSHECIVIPGPHSGIIDIQDKALDISGMVLIKITSAAGDPMETWFSAYVVGGLSDDLVLGWDFIKHVGMTVDTVKGNLTIAFPKGRHLIEPRTILNLAAASQADKRSWQTTISPRGNSNPHIPAQTSRVVRCKIDTQDGLQVRAGTTVLVEQLDDGSDQRLVVRSGLYKVRNNNEITVIIDNHEFFDAFVTSSGALKSARVSSVSEAAMTEADPKIVAALTRGANTPRPTKPTSPMDKEKADFIWQSLDLSGVPEHFKSRYKKFVEENHDIFSANEYDIGKADVMEHIISPTSDNPIFIGQFKIPQEHQAFVDAFVDRALIQGVVEECRSPHNSPIFVVAKPGGGLRIVQDLRAVNDGSLDDQYSIADVKQCIDTVGREGSKVFSTLDLTSAFWQLPLAENSRDFTAFTLYHRNTQYRWKRTVMGLKGAPASFSRLMGIVFKGQKNVITYVDDALVYTANHGLMLERLQEVAQRLREHNLKLNPKKTSLGLSSVKYLGFDIDEDGIRPSKDKLAAIKALEPPKDPKQVKEFLGLTTFFSRMIKDYSRIAAPLQDLTKKSCTWTGGQLPENALKAFHSLKNTLMAEPILAYPQVGKPFNLSVDACLGDDGNPGGLGAILSQRQMFKGKLEDRVIQYWSRRLKDKEPDGSAYSCEKKAMVEALEAFHHYCYGNKTHIWTDHKPLVGASKKEIQLFTRLDEILSRYDIEIHHRPGKDNPADCLSRQTANVAAAESVRNNTIRKHQAADPLVKAIRYTLVKQQIPDSLKLWQPIVMKNISKFTEMDGIIWYLDSAKAKARLVTPATMFAEVLTSCHGLPTTGHWSVEKTFQFAATDYWWPTQAADVANWCQSCPRCLEARGASFREPLSPWPEATDFNDRVHLDLTGPFKSVTINKYIAVLSDAFTKWVVAIPIPDKQAETVARAYFDNYICVYTAPRLLVTDGGGEFNNELLREVCKLTGTKKHVISPLHPQANGQVERVNLDLKNYLTAHCNDTWEWEAWVKPFTVAYNTCPHRSTQQVPFTMLFGREPRLPATPDRPPILYAPDPAKEMIVRLLEAREAARESNKLAREEYKKYFDKKASTRDFQPGDEVLVKFPPPPGSNPKLYPKFRSGYVVDSLGDHGVVNIINCKTRKKEQQHKDRLKLVVKRSPELANNLNKNESNLVKDNKAPEQYKKSIIKEHIINMPGIPTFQAGNENIKSTINKHPVSGRQLPITSTGLPFQQNYSGPMTRSRSRQIEIVHQQTHVKDSNIGKTVNIPLDFSISIFSPEDGAEPVAVERVAIPVAAPEPPPRQHRPDVSGEARSRREERERRRFEDAIEAQDSILEESFQSFRSAVLEFSDEEMQSVNNTLHLEVTDELLEEEEVPRAPGVQDRLVGGRDDVSMLSLTGEQKLPARGKVTFRIPRKEPGGDGGQDVHPGHSQQEAESWNWRDGPTYESADDDSEETSDDGSDSLDPRHPGVQAVHGQDQKKGQQEGRRGAGQPEAAIPGDRGNDKIEPIFKKRGRETSASVQQPSPEKPPTRRTRTTGPASPPRQLPKRF